MKPKELPISDKLAVEILGDCVVIRFTNPKERNPLSVNILLKLDKTLDEIAHRKNITKIIFTGSENVFAAGANLREIAELTEETARDYALRGQTLMNRISNAEPLTIAAVNGFCFGGAFDLALSCKIRLASPDALFCHPGANLGIMTGWSGTQKLPRLIGEAAALEAFLTAKKIDAVEALRIGLISEIHTNPLLAAQKIVPSCL